MTERQVALVKETGRLYSTNDRGEPLIGSPVARLLEERQRLLEALKDARDEIRIAPTGDYHQFDAAIAFAEEAAP